MLLHDQKHGQWRRDVVYKLTENIPSETKGVTEQAMAFRKQVIPAMERLRTTADALENLIPQDKWPFPCYSEILYNI